jgi:hypothetical protein
MPDGPRDAPGTETLTAPDTFRPVMGRLARGLSALFWGLPIALVLAIQGLTINPFGQLGLVSLLAPSAGFGLLFYGLFLLGTFPGPDPVWPRTLDRARFFALTCLGLSPFLHWYQRVPDTEMFVSAVHLLGLFGVALLITINALLRRFTAALPDPLLRLETAAFTRINNGCLLALPLIVLAWTLAWRWTDAPVHVRLLLQWIEPFRLFVLLFLTLLPLSMTMSLLWKTKETLLGLCTVMSCHVSPR